MSEFSTAMSCYFQPQRFYNRHSASQRAAVAVSACLLGEKVRYDGADKLLAASPLLQTELNLIPICPEMGAGLGVPRPPVQLITANNEIRAIGREDRNLDVTAALQNYAVSSLQHLMNRYSLCGYLWKSRSPSCGLGSTPLFDHQGAEIDHTSGLQAYYFQRHLPHLNHAEDTELENINAAVNFVLRCRLVFDLLYAANAALNAVHEHYQFLHTSFDVSVAKKLEVLSEENNEASYLAALLSGCSQIPEEELIALFK